MRKKAKRRKQVGTKAATTKGPSKLEARLHTQIQSRFLPEPETQYRFHVPAPGEKKRQWRSDFAWPEYRLIAEVEGAVWTGGRHVRGAGFHNDTIKYNTALIQGWRVLRFTSKSITDGSAVEMIELALNTGEEE